MAVPRRAQVEYAKLRLMCCVAGLDRGFAASKAAAREVEAAVQALVSAGGPVDLLAASGEPGLRGSRGGLYALAFNCPTALHKE